MQRPDYAESHFDLNHTPSARNKDRVGNAEIMMSLTSGYRFEPRRRMGHDVPVLCPRRPNSEPPRRLNFEPGWRPV